MAAIARGMHPQRRFRGVPAALLYATLLGGLAAGSAAGADEVDFLRDVRPILSDNCLKCHGPDEATRESGLRLDEADGALLGGASGRPVVVPGRSAESLLIERVTAADASRRMPPGHTNLELTDDEIDVLRRWIDAGAPYAAHWAFVPPERPQLPATTDPSWPRNEVDRFVFDRLQREQLRPSPEADRATLLRRLSLDLIGLPPTPQEIDAFVADESPGAYERQVDRLLASERFGEKWARHWLDAARYADSDGYEKDLPRSQWLWRDWVIRALNDDMPYDRFIIEQVAGDLLPGATQDQRVATGFLRNGMVNEEGAIIAEQFRLEGLFDRIECISKGVLGLTLQCAQCHTHKFDPISHDEYFGLLALLNNDYEAQSWVYTQEQLQQIESIREETRRVEQRLQAEHPEWAERMEGWVERVHAERIEWDVLEPIEHEWVGGLAHPERLPDNSVLTLGFRPTDGELFVTAETSSGITGLRLEALTHGDLPFGGPGRSVKGTFAVSELVVEARPSNDDSASWEKVPLGSATADFAQPEQPLDPFFHQGDDDARRVGPAEFLIDGEDETAWGADRGPGRRHQDVSAVVQFEEPIGFPEGTLLKITLRFKHGGADGHGRQNNFLGRFRLSVTDDAEPRADGIPSDVRRTLELPRDTWTPEQQAAVFSHWRTTVAEFAEASEAIERLWAEHPEGDSVLNVVQRLPEHRRETRLLERGDWQSPAHVVAPHVPAVLHPLPDDAPADRLAFARWLVDRRSPTTARVAVNRLWQVVFGQGLVETPEDFGVRASLPTHPELLDWLAVEFMDNGWSTKQALRTIVTSATYRQSSNVTPELVERDPRNRLLARGPRFRAEAEVVRDVALAASGLLHERVGGPSFFPPVPEGLFALSFVPVDFWETAEPPQRYRRSLYVFRRRSIPDPLLACFDAPNADAAIAARARSNTPLAALAALNEQVFVEASRAMALRVLREGGGTDAERIEYAFLLTTGRRPSAEETAELVEFIAGRKARLADGWLSAWEVATGDPARKPELPPGATPTEAAAWTIVSRILLNLDETLSKN